MIHDYLLEKVAQERIRERIEGTASARLGSLRPDREGVAARVETLWSRLIQQLVSRRRGSKKVSASLVTMCRVQGCC